MDGQTDGKTEDVCFQKSQPHGLCPVFPTGLSGFSGRYKYSLVSKIMMPVSQQSAPRGPRPGGHLLSPSLGLRKGAGALRLPFVRLKRTRGALTEEGGILDV